MVPIFATWDYFLLKSRIDFQSRIAGSVVFTAVAVAFVVVVAVVVVFNFGLMLFQLLTISFVHFQI